MLRSRGCRSRQRTARRARARERRRTCAARGVMPLERMGVASAKKRGRAADAPHRGFQPKRACVAAWEINLERTGFFRREDSRFIQLCGALQVPSTWFIVVLVAVMRALRNTSTPPVLFSVDVPGLPVPRRLLGRAPCLKIAWFHRSLENIWPRVTNRDYHSLRVLTIMV